MEVEKLKFFFAYFIAYHMGMKATEYGIPYIVHIYGASMTFFPKHLFFFSKMVAEKRLLC